MNKLVVHVRLASVRHSLFIPVVALFFLFYILHRTKVYSLPFSPCEFKVNLVFYENEHTNRIHSNILIKTTSKEKFTKKDTATFNSNLAIHYNNETYSKVRASQQKTCLIYRFLLFLFTIVSVLLSF